MLRVTPTIAIDERELSFSFVRAGGPGGQHVNKVATAVQLRFDAASSPALPAPVLARLRRLAGRRMTAVGVLVLTARRSRSQERNRAEVVERLVELLRLAARAPRTRRPSKPSRAAERRQLEAKQHRASLKRSRRAVRDFDAR